jgi:opacity protein-like surface antigen
MRSVICALALLALPTSAFAGDFDILRGTVPTYRWSGFYAGGDFGYSGANINFGQAAGPDISNILRNTAIEQDEQISQWPVLGGESYPSSINFGGFVGYNTEWDGVVLGLEADYSRVSINASSNGSITRFFTDSADVPPGHNLSYTLTASGQAAFKLTDIVSLRARAGWETGNLLPYAFAGIALSRANVSNSGTVGYSAIDYPDSETPPLAPIYTAADPLVFGPDTQTTAQSTFAYGVDAGVGVDAGITSHVFVRGELEYIYFAPIDGIRLSISSARAGIGYKF